MIFKQDSIRERLTSNLIQDLYNSVCDLMDYDFSAYNIITLIIKMNGKIVGGIESTILDLFDDWTGKYHWSETTANRHYYDGWKTNDCFKVGKKVIVPFYGAFDNWDKKFRSYNVMSKFRDVEKVFDFLDSGRTDWQGDLDLAFRVAADTQNTRNIDTKYFKVTFYKKGTAHFEFKDMDLLEKFNLFAGRHKNWLPPRYAKVRYEHMNDEERAVVDSFQGQERYEHIMANAEYYLCDGSCFGPVPLALESANDNVSELSFDEFLALVS